MTPARRASVTGVAFVIAYVAWAAWFAHPLFTSHAPGAFDGLYVMVPGFPWTFLMAWLQVPTNTGMIAVSWILNGALFYWWGTVWAEWFKRYLSAGRS